MGSDLYHSGRVFGGGHHVVEFGRERNNGGGSRDRHCAADRFAGLMRLGPVGSGADVDGQRYIQVRGPFHDLLNKLAG